MKALQRRMLPSRVRLASLRHRIWYLEPRRDLTISLIAGGIGGLMVIGILAATGPNFNPISPLGEAFTVEVSDSGVPYVAIDPDAVGENGSEPTQANGDGQGGRGRSLPILLFPLDG